MLDFPTTPINTHNPKVSEHVINIIEKCLAIQPEARYQTAGELRLALMEARSISRRKLPLELVLQPPPITLHDRLPDGNDSQLMKSHPAINSQIARIKHKATRPISSENESQGLTEGKTRNKRKILTWFILALFSIILLSGSGIYASRPDWIPQTVRMILPGFAPSYTSSAEPKTETFMPVLQVTTATLSPTNTSTFPSTSTPLPTSTRTRTPTATITPTLPPTPMGGSAQIAFASNRSGAVEIWLMNIDGSALEMITDIPEGVCQPRWSPDGREIVFISPCKRNMTSYPGASLFIMNADGTGLVPLPSVPGGDYDPSWSPDGKQIVFTSLRNGGVPGIFIINRVDNTVKSLVEDETRAISQPAWSPDGKLIAYVSSDNRIWVMDTNGDNRRSLMIGGGDYILNGPAWSPDGTVVIYTRTLFSDITGSTMLMAVPVTETGEIPVEVPNSQLVSDANYSMDGYWLLFTSWFSGSHDINVMRANGVDRHAIEAGPAYDFDPVWRPIKLEQP